MAWLTRVTYTGNGSQQDFTFNIPYLSQNDVYVYLDGTLQGSGYSFSDATTIHFTAAPGNGVEVVLRRLTDRSVLSSLSFGGTPGSADINRVLLRVQYIMQEAADAALEGALSESTSVTFDALSHRIINLADGVAANDAVNRGQLDGKQPLDATLTALAAVTTAANKLIYASGVDTFSTTDLTTFARTLIAAADAAASRTVLGLGALAVLDTVNNSNWSGTALSIGNGGTGSTTASGARTALGLAIGTDVQAADATLTALAAVTTAADKLIYATGADAFATTDLTSFARSILGGVDAASVRTLLGLGSLATLSTVNNSNWSGTQLAEANGGTNQTTYALGDTLYSSATNTLSRLSGNTTTTKKFLSQTGNGTVSAAPTWSQPAFTEISGTLGLTQGGTGQTTANAALNALLPTQTSNSGKYLTTNGTDSSWATIAGLSLDSIAEVLTGTDAAKAVTADALAALWEKGSDIASAAAIHIPSTGGGYFVVTGTTTITSIVDDNTPHNGRSVKLRFSGALTLTHNATSLILPGSANITTAAGDVATFITEDGTNWRCIGYNKADGQLVLTPMVWLQDQKSAATDGGGSTGGSWQTRTLNTKVLDNASICTLASNQFSLPAGTYQVQSFMDFRNVGQATSRIQNITDTTTLVRGMNAASGAASVGQQTSLHGVFTITGTKTLELQYYCTNTTATTGLGAASGSGTTEVYANVIIRKLA